MYSFSRFVTKDIIIKSEEERTVTGIVTAEIIDKQGEITIRDHLLKAIRNYMKNSNRSMSDTHTNRIVGEWAKAYPVTIVDLNDNKVAGIAIEGHIFKGTKMYDEVWAKVKAKIYKGLSFGGSTNSDRVPVTQRDGMIAYQLKDLDVYEIAICQEPAVPWAILTSFNQLAKSYTSKQIQDMRVFEKDDDQVIIQCEANVCYVNQTTDTIVDYEPIEQIETVMLKSSQERNLNKDMSKELTKEDKKDEKDEKDEEKSSVAKEEHNDKDDKKEDEEKSSKTKQDDKKDEDDDKDEDKSDIESLKEIIGDLAKTVHQSIKQDQKWKKDLRSEIDGMKKALETPAPAEEHSGGDDVKLNNEYNDDPQGGTRASEDPKEADSEGEEDDINMEEKSKRVEKTSKDVKKTPYPSADINLDELLSNTEGSAVLKAARESGDLGKIALMINKGAFGKVRSLPLGYPQVSI